VAEAQIVKKKKKNKKKKRKKEKRRKKKETCTRDFVMTNIKMKEQYPHISMLQYTARGVLQTHGGLVFNIHKDLHGHILCKLLLWHCFARSPCLIPTLVLVIATCLASPEMAGSFTVYMMLYIGITLWTWLIKYNSSAVFNTLRALNLISLGDLMWHGKVSSLPCCLDLKCGF
jgi:hypothetical protein